MQSNPKPQAIKNYQRVESPSHKPHKYDTWENGMIKNRLNRMKRSVIVLECIALYRCIEFIGNISAECSTKVMAVGACKYYVTLAEIKHNTKNVYHVKVAASSSLRPRDGSNKTERE